MVTFNIVVESSLVWEHALSCYCFNSFLVKKSRIGQFHAHLAINPSNAEWIAINLRCSLHQEGRIVHSLDEGIKKKVLTAGNFVAEATKAAQRGKVSLEELLNTIRGQAKSSGDIIVFAPYMIIDDVKKKLSLTLPPNISISSSKMDKSIRISGIPAALDRIISNLSNNALFAMKEMGGTLTFGLEKETLTQQLITPYAPPIPPGNYAKFTIADTGTGMDSNTLERIFSPFFTTKAPGEGLGLGLSSALRLLKEGNAYLTVQTRLGEGTIFNLYWSLYNESQGEQNVHSSNY
jgi:signal transduction histidine kinase